MCYRSRVSTPESPTEAEAAVLAEIHAVDEYIQHTYEVQRETGDRRATLVNQLALISGRDRAAALLGTGTSAIDKATKRARTPRREPAAEKENGDPR